jgi:uncharacterized SAM-binding protein YcdF (DUF218 family)
MNYILLLGNSDVSVCQQRCNVAANYFKLYCKPKIDEETGTIHSTARIICSGGIPINIDGNTMTEAEYMSYYLIREYGVNKHDIILEKLSRNTEENMTMCKDLFTKGKLIKPTTQDNWVSQITICSSKFHIKRALVIAQHVFFNSGVGNIKVIYTDEFVSEDTFIKEIKLIDQYLAKVIGNSTYFC